MHIASLHMDLISPHAVESHPSALSTAQDLLFLQILIS